ncbi:hypothetical protein RclHR1_15600001 [Rhizophagus clarus]|uniref:Uncharacterized protein n=1 Tax=Rhizophagus clarus TaxID=94130 RepID=A0A2Z6QT35_9GLOM|nr:hypothetical protein RclHR1_15600001 [Rhizophagus clarus]GET03053.1 hypothetical protein RCL_jg8248.t1 [Rhizophagus clarus]
MTEVTTEATIDILQKQLKFCQQMLENMFSVRLSSLSPPSSSPSSFSPTSSSPTSPLPSSPSPFSPSSSSSSPFFPSSFSPSPLPLPSTSLIIVKPTKNYIPIEDILNLAKISKEQYNNMLTDIWFIMMSMKIDFNIPYKRQDITRISKIIEKFKRRNPNSQVGEGNWIIKELIKKHFHHRWDYNNRKNKNNKKGNEHHKQEKEQEHHEQEQEHHEEEQKHCEQEQECVKHREKECREKERREQVHRDKEQEQECHKKEHCEQEHREKERCEKEQYEQKQYQLQKRQREQKQSAKLKNSKKARLQKEYIEENKENNFIESETDAEGGSERARRKMKRINYKY